MKNSAREKEQNVFFCQKNILKKKYRQLHINLICKWHNNNNNTENNSTKSVSQNSQDIGWWSRSNQRKKKRLSNIDLYIKGERKKKSIAVKGKDTASDRSEENKRKIKSQIYAF